MDLSVFKNAVESSINAIGITDLEGKLKYVNDSCVKMWGYNNKDEILGRFLPEFWEGDGIFRTIKELNEKGIAEGEDVGKRKDGSLLNVQFTASMIKDQADTLSFMFGSFFDITDRKQAEKALRESEIKHKALVQNVPGMIYRGYADWSAEVLSGSEEVCGYTNEELNSKKENWLGIIHSDDKTNVFKEGSELAKRKQKTVQTYRIVTKDGDIRWVEDRKISLFSKEGEFIGIDGIVFDITERKQAEEALKLREKQLEEQSQHLEEVNTAMKILLKKREEDKIELQEKVLINVKELVLNYLEKLKNSGLNSIQKTYVDIMESNLQDIVSPFLLRLSKQYANLTSSEVKIAELIRQGKTSKEISELFNLSPRTVEFHRDNIREKMRLKNRKINLRTHLLSLES